MTAIKIIGIVLLGLCFIIFCLLISPVKIYIDFTKGKPLVLSARYLFIKYDTRRQKPKPEVMEEKAEKKQKPNKLKQYIADNGVAATVEAAIKILRSFFGRIKVILRHIRITRLNIKCVCAGDDAAAAAIGYGAVCAAVYPFVSFLQKKTKMKTAPEINLACDFDTDYYDYGIMLNFKISLFYFIKMLLLIVYDYAEEKDGKHK